MIEDADGTWVATFTDDASTVIVAGPKRTFNERPTADGPTATASVQLGDIAQLS